MPNGPRLKNEERLFFSHASGGSNKERLAEQEYQPIDVCIYKLLYWQPVGFTTVSNFEWDEGNRAKCEKHEVTIAEIEAVFRNPHRLAPDVAHSTEEARFLIIGLGEGTRPIFAIFTLREVGEKTVIRPISARYMHRKEIDRYEQATSITDQ